VGGIIYFKGCDNHMGKIFFTNTPQDREYEKMMQEVPHSHKKGSGTFKFGRDFYFKDRTHQKRWKDFCDKLGRSQTVTLGFMAALYLLASDDALWSAAQGRHHSTTIDFDRICAENNRLDSLILLEVAKRVYRDAKSVTLGEILKSTTMHTDLQKLLINSFFILEYSGEG